MRQCLLGIALLARHDARGARHVRLMARFLGAWCVCTMLGACGTSADAPPTTELTPGSNGPRKTHGASVPEMPLFGTPDASDGNVRVNPTSATLKVDPTSGAPAVVTFTVTGPGVADPVWAVDNTALGSIDSSGRFVASGHIGGQTKVRARIGSVTVVADLTVVIEYRQNGASVFTLPEGDAGGQAGGPGGVGGDGVGGPVLDTTIATLEGAAAADPTLALLYPYDQTVFPLNVLPPLLQWSAGTSGNFDAVYVHVSVPPYYDYKGFFGRPSALTPGANFVRHPIPSDVWAAATTTAAGGTMKVEIVLSAGGKAFGPVSETYKIALGKISGKIYYQAYNTVLAKNYSGALGGDRFGGATLSIKVGAQAPELVAGKTTSDTTGCRVCHSVSAYGDRMLVQHGDDYAVSSTYELKNGNLETSPYPPGELGLGFAGLYPDGTLGLSNSVDVSGGVLDQNTALYDMATAAAVQAPGLGEFATKIGLPMFSPDGTHVAFTPFAGPSTPGVGAPTGRQLVVMDFDRMTRTFSHPRKLWETAASDERPAWPTFFPSSSAVVFMRHFQGSANEAFASRSGARGELWWTDLATGTSTSLDALNGLGYVPKGPNAHDQDERLQYEPTISPVPSGGYAWIVFMSRRTYGNVATIDPWWSDPREHDLGANVTPKKLWMAALDLNPTPGEDPSHPAFYVPGQELHGSNSRPFFALDPCLSDGGTCSSGTDCCGGHCQNGLCANLPPDQSCSPEGDRCTVAADCCDPKDQCIGSVCSVVLR